MLCNSYNMGTSDLPEIYARARGPAGPECKCVYFRQIKSAHVITNILHSYNSLSVKESAFISLIVFIVECITIDCAFKRKRIVFCKHEHVGK